MILYLFSAGCGATAGNPAPDFYLRHHPLSLPIVKKEDILQKNPIRGGFFLFEIGYDQADALLALANKHGLSHTRVIRDLGGNDRVVYLSKNSPYERKKRI